MEGMGRDIKFTNSLEEEEESEDQKLVKENSIDQEDGEDQYSVNGRSIDHIDRDEEDQVDGNLSQDSSSSSGSSERDFMAPVVLDLPPSHRSPAQSLSQLISASNTLSNDSQVNLGHGSAINKSSLIDQESKVDTASREDFMPEALQLALSNRSSEALQADGWSTHRSQTNYIGKCVRRYFPGYGIADGAVVGHLTAEENDGHPMWHVVHEDGDSEDISEDDYELCHDLFVRDISSLESLRKQNNPPGPSQEDIERLNNQHNYRGVSKQKNNIGSQNISDFNMVSSEPRKGLSYERRSSDYILHESIESKEIREGEEYQVSCSCIPIATPFIQSEDMDFEADIRPMDGEDFLEFITWAKKQFLQPGMVTMAYLPTASIVNASTNETKSPSFNSDINISSLQPVLHHLQRYCVVVSYLESKGDASDEVMVFDGIRHHVVDAKLCSLETIPLMSEKQDDINVLDYESVGVFLLNSWSKRPNPKEDVEELCKEFRLRQVTEEAMDGFLKLWREHKQSLGKYSKVLLRKGLNSKQVATLYQLLLPFLCSTPVDRASFQLKGVHRLADMLNGRMVYVPPAYSRLEKNYDLESRNSTDVCIYVTPVIRQVEGGWFGQDSDNEDVFFPKHVIPRATLSAPLPSKKRELSQSPRTLVRKIEKYDLSTGEVLDIYESQSKAAQENEGVTQSQISCWCRGVFTNSRKEHSVGYRFHQPPSPAADISKPISKTDESSDHDGNNSGNIIEEKPVTSEADVKIEISSELDCDKNGVEKNDTEKYDIDENDFDEDDLDKKEVDDNGVECQECSDVENGMSDGDADVITDRGNEISENLSSQQANNSEADTQTEYSYEIDDGRYEASPWNFLFPTHSLLSQRRRRMLGSHRHHFHHRQYHESFGQSDSHTRKDFARLATAKQFGYIDEHEAAIASRENPSVKRRRRGVTSGHRRKAVEQYNLITGQTIKVFSSGSEAAKVLNISPNSVSCCCTGRMTNVEGFGFRFAVEKVGENKNKTCGLNRNESNPQIQRRRGGGRGNGKSVVQYDISTGVVIKVFRSGSQAAKALGLQQTSISQCCLGRKHSVGNFGFRFENGQVLESDSSDADSDDESKSRHHNGDEVRSSNDVSLKRNEELNFPKRVYARRKGVVQYVLDTGEIIQEFLSCRHAADSLGLQKSIISLCCNNQLDGIGPHGFRFSEGEDKNISKEAKVRKPYTKSTNGVPGAKKKPVEQYDLITGETIATFSSGAEAARSLGLNRASVSLCCMGRQKGINDEYGIRFAPVTEKHSLRKVRKKQSQVPIELFDTCSGQTIETYSSTSLASTRLRISSKAISQCCSGELDGMGDISFRFKKSPESSANTSVEVVEGDIVHSSKDIPVGTGVKKAVEKFDLRTGETMETFSSSFEAANSAIISRIAVSLCCIGCQAGVGSCGFRFVESSDREDVKENSSLWRLPAPKSNFRKAVEQYTLETGETIMTFESGAEAARVVGTNPGTISMCCQGLHGGVGTYSFRFSAQNTRDVSSSSGVKYSGSNQLNTLKRNVSVAIGGDDMTLPLAKRRTNYRGDSANNINGRPKEVAQFDIATGKVINIFRSGSQAAQKLGLSQSNVSHCCRGKSHSAGGYGFRFTVPEDDNSDTENSRNDVVRGVESDKSNDSAISPETYPSSIGGGSGEHVLLQQANALEISDEVNEVNTTVNNVESVDEINPNLPAVDKISDEVK